MMKSTMVAKLTLGTTLYPILKEGKIITFSQASADDDRNRREQTHIFRRIDSIVKVTAGTS